jgi:(S)-2-hydroxy-acid oxidase
MSRDLISVEDYRLHAEKKMPKMYYDYYASGSADQITLRENERAFRCIRLLPRSMVDVSKVDTQTSILGHRVPTPILIAATAMHKLATPEGEKDTYRAASELGTVMCLSSLSTTSMEEVAAVGNGILWFQLYVLKDRQHTLNLVRRAERVGCKALVLTVDTPILGSREADHRNAFCLPPGLVLEHYRAELSDAHLPSQTGQSGLNDFVSRNLDASLTWNSLTWLCTQTSLPVLVKGILRSSDAVRAVQAGARGIIVSNHGARQLDTVPATIRVLPEIVRTLREHHFTEVYLDGGIRRGTDVLKALALGAKAVFVGRPVLWGLAHSGKEGVKAVLTLLNNEFRNAMILAGCRTIADIDESLIYRKSSLKSKL